MNKYNDQYHKSPELVAQPANVAVVQAQNVAVDQPANVAVDQAQNVDQGENTGGKRRR